MSGQWTDFIRETENFEAFELVTEALERIDSYDVSKQNVEVLQEADDRLTEALADGVDPNYLKAQYLQAMVRYLKGEPAAALRWFEQMDGRVIAESSLGREVSYNIAAAHSALRNWSTAISKFNDVIKVTRFEPGKSTNNDSEVCLLARAGVAFSYAGRIGEVRNRLEELEGRKSEEALASRKRLEQEVGEYFGSIENEYGLAQNDAQRVSDQRLVRESEQIFREAYEKVEGPRAGRIIELVPEAPEKRRRIFGKRLIRVLIILFVLLILGLVSVELWWGWDHVFPLIPAS